MGWPIKNKETRVHFACKTVGNSVRCLRDTRKKMTQQKQNKKLQNPALVAGF